MFHNRYVLSGLEQVTVTLYSPGIEYRWSVLEEKCNKVREWCNNNSAKQ